MDEGKPLYMLPAVLAFFSAIIYGLAVVAEYFTQGYSEWWPYLLYSIAYFFAYLLLVFPPERIAIESEWVALALSAIGVVISIPAIYPCLVFFGGIGGGIALLIALYYFIKTRYYLSIHRRGLLLSLLRIVPAVSMYPVVVYYTIMTFYELFTFGRPPGFHELNYYWLLTYVVAYVIIVTMLTSFPDELGNKKDVAIVLNILALTSSLAVYTLLPYPQKLAAFTGVPIALGSVVISAISRPRKRQQQHRVRIPVVEGELV